MRRLFRFSVVLTVFLLGQVGFGVTREVGSGQTYSTIQACHTAASAGDVCNIHAGSYTGTVTVSKSIKFQNNSGESPVLTGYFSLGSTANVTITCNNGGGQMEITGFGTPSVAVGGGVYQDSGTGLTVTGCYIHDGYGAGIYSRNSTKLTIRSNKLDHNLQANCCVDGAGIILIGAHSTDGTFANGTLIELNVVSNNAVDGMQVHSQYITVQDNQVLDNITTDWANTHPDGIQLNAGSADGFTSTAHVKVLRNVFRNFTQGVFIEGSVSGESSDALDTTVANNILFNTSGTVNGVDMSSLQVNAIVVKFVNGAYIYNNTVGDVRSNCVLVQDSKNGTVHIKNNICEQASGFGYDIEATADVASGEFDYNQCKLTNGDCAIWGGTFFSTLATFHTAVSLQMTHKVDASAKLNAFPTPKLQLGSAAIDVGFDLTSTCTDCTTDKAGLTRTAPWEMGAFEFIRPGPPSNLRTP